MSTGSSNTKPFKLFQIRWAEKLGLQEAPYLIRWTLILFGYSIRLHHWIKSDDRRFFHDHSCDLISLIIKGKYKNVTPDGTFEAVAWKPRKMKATVQHYLDIPVEGAWTIIFCGRPYHKWGFYVRGKRIRPLEYFHRYGIIQDRWYQ